MVAPVVRIQKEDFDIASEIDALSQSDTNIGAIVTFSGLCRDEAGKLAALELEHYPGMAESQIAEYASKAIARFDLAALLAVHRYGKISPGENIVLVIAAARHRQAAFDGANFVMDYLKTGAPFWKKEHLAEGGEGEWVDARDSDNDALEKWR